jgi:aspartyl-tRNA(Asn)/glutamyl-tRNA(Gln) amidotransferase subunit C
MEIEESLIDKLAHLSRLEFSQEEKSVLKSDFEKMLDFVNKLNELDTSGVEPLLHISSNVNVLREDISANEISREQALSNAGLKDESFFMVPKVINK